MGPLDGWRKLEKWPHSSDSSEGFLRCNPCGLSVIQGGALRKANRSFLLHCVNAMASPGLGMTPSGPNAALEIPSGNSSDRGTPPPRGKLSYPAKTGRIPSPPQSPAGITTKGGIELLPPLAPHAGEQADARRHPELGEYRAHVLLDRVLRDAQLARDLAVRQPFPHQAQHLPLPAAEPRARQSGRARRKKVSPPGDPPRGGRPP